MNNVCQPNFKQQNKKNQNALSFAIILTFLYGIIEAFVGWSYGSLALISDAGHMFTDSAALLLAWLAGIVMNRPPSDKHSYGMARFEVITALVNAIFMLIIIATICYEAIHRIFDPVDVNGSMVFIVAIIGLIINLLVAFRLSKSADQHGHANLNTKAALLHVVGDLLGSVAAILAGAIIYFTGWMPIDPILSIVICLIIIKSVYKLLKDSFLVLMEGVPESINLHEVSNFLNKITHVKGVSDLHVWNLSSGYVALTAHIRVNDLEEWPQVLAQATTGLKEKFAIKHITIQPEL